MASGFVPGNRHGVPGGLGQAAGDNPVVEAARRGDIAAVRALIAKRANVNEPSRDGSTALLWAAYHADLPMAQALIAAGATTNAANKYGVTPLLQASRTGATPVVQALFERAPMPSRRIPKARRR